MELLESGVGLDSLEELLGAFWWCTCDVGSCCVDGDCDEGSGLEERVDEREDIARRVVAGDVLARDVVNEAL